MPLPMPLSSGETKLSEVTAILEEETKMEEAEMVNTPTQVLPQMGLTPPAALPVGYPTANFYFS